MPRTKLFFAGMFFFLVSSVLLCCAYCFAAEMIPAHQVGGFTVPTLPADASPWQQLLLVCAAVLGPLWGGINEICAMMKNWKFNSVGDFFLKAYQALIVKPDAGTAATEHDLLQQLLAKVEQIQLPDVPLPAVSEAPAPAAAVPTPEDIAVSSVAVPTAADIAAAQATINQAAAANAAQAVQGQGGFIAIKLLAIVSLAALALSFTGCAQIQSALQKDTPQSLSAKTLLSARQAVIGTAETLSTLCQQGKIDMQTCAGIQQKYLQAQIAYNTASDLETAAFAVGAAPDTLTKYQSAESQLLVLFQDFQTVGKQFGVGSP